MIYIVNSVTLSIGIIYLLFIFTLDGREFKYKAHIISKYFNVMKSNYIHQSLFPSDKMFNNEPIKHYNNLFSFSRFINVDEKLIELNMNTDNIYSAIIMLHALKTMNRINSAYKTSTITSSFKLKTKNMLWINKNLINLWNADEILCKYHIKTTSDIRELISIKTSSVIAYLPKATAPYYNITSSSPNFKRQQITEARPRIMFKLFYGNDFNIKNYLTSKSETLPSLASSYLDFNYNQYKTKKVYDNTILNQGLCYGYNPENPSEIEIPSFESMIADSAKLSYLNKLLPRLKAEGHRVLIFCQV